MKIQIELTEDEKRQAFLDYCWKHYGLDGDEANVYTALGQIVYYFYPEREDHEKDNN